MPRGYWTCQRRSDGIPCRKVNANRLRKCERCGKKKPPKREPAHRKALTELTYEDYVRLNGGTHCAICGREPSPGKKHRRDHAHVGDGIPRGLLCWRHNQGLQMFGDDPALLRAAAGYVERAEQRAASSVAHSTIPPAEEG